MLRLIILLLTGFLILTMPSSAQDAQSINKLLYDSAASFKQDNYFLGVSQVGQACAMLRRNPAASPGDNYIDIAAGTLDAVNKSIRDAQARRDFMTVTRRVSALQPLLQSLQEWEPQNPRWHYEKGMLFRTQSTSMNDRYPAILEQAIAEFKKTLAMSGGGSYHDNAQNQIGTCQQIIQRRNAEMAEYRRTHPPPRYNSQPGNSTPDQSPYQTYCPKCGGSHSMGVCPNVHGG